MREISSLHLKIFVHKECKLLSVYVMDDENNDKKHKIEDMPILIYFK